VPTQINDLGPANAEQAKRRERANRILDAAAELIQRWGYRKTTMDDIAKRAGVAKGVLYLHWKTREQLFEMLLFRERLLVADDLMQRLANDPEGGTLHGIMKHTFLVTMSRPLIRGIFLQDTELLGSLLELEAMQEAVHQKMEAFITYVSVLRRYRLIRTDLSDQTLASALTAITVGFMVVDPLLPAEYKTSFEEAAEMLAETVRRTFEPCAPPSDDALREVSAIFQQMYCQVIELAQQQMQEMEA
jgi:AcrR family transcriptional regulator